MMTSAWIQQTYRACSLGFLTPILIWPSVESFGWDITWNVSIPHVWLSSICFLLLVSSFADICFPPHTPATRKTIPIIFFTINLSLAWMALYQHMQAWFLAASFASHALWLAWMLWNNEKTQATWWYWTAWMRDSAAALIIFIWLIAW